jgi:hypothetical protein
MQRKRIFALSLLSFLFTFNSGLAQESNLQRYTPARLFNNGAFEANLFHNLYTQSKVRDVNGDLVDLNQRQTFFNGLYQFTYGASNSGRWNVGVDVNYNRALYDGEKGSALNVLFSGKGDFNRLILGSVGPRIKFIPFKALPTFSIQSTFLFPVAAQQESPSFTGHDRYTWNTQFFYDLKINESWRIFAETGFLYRIKRYDYQTSFFNIPTSLFLSYFPNSRVTLYGFGQYSPAFRKQSNEIDQIFGLSNWYTQIGVGVKYQLATRLGLELSYGNFILSRKDGAGEVINFGIRYIR